MSDALAQAGGLAGALGLVVLVLGTRRWQRLAGFGGWAAGMGLLAHYLAPHGHRGLLVGAALVGLLIAALVAALFLAWPWLLPLLTLAAVPVRIPVHVGAVDAKLLLPLYAVVAAAALALFWQLPVDERRPRELGAAALPLGLLVGWSGSSVLWSGELRRDAVELTFFVLPFGLLTVTLARLDWNRRALTWLYAQLSLEAAAFAAVGLYQWVSRDDVWRPPALPATASAPAFRVDSVFYDHGTFGRFLAVAILAGVVVLLARPPLRLGLIVTAAVSVTWLGLYFAHSDSSLGALVVGLLVASALYWRWQAGVAATVTAVLVLTVAYADPNVTASDVPRLALVVWLLAEALLAAFRRAGVTFTGRAAAAFGIMLAAIAVHSLFRDTLLEDPLTWALVAFAALVSRTREPV